MTKSCRPNGRMSDVTRFALRVWARGDCWEWRGARDNRPGKGYGYFFAQGQRHIASRYAYELAKGPIPPGYEVDHLCRHPWCVRPSHLEAVTPALNRERNSSIQSRNARKTHCRCGRELEWRKRSNRTAGFSRYCSYCQNERLKQIIAERGPYPRKKKAA